MSRNVAEKVRNVAEKTRKIGEKTRKCPDKVYKGITPNRVWRSKPGDRDGKSRATFLRGARKEPLYKDSTTSKGSETQG